MERALAMLARLLEGEADRLQLIQAVRDHVEDAYAQSPEDSFHRDLRLLRGLGFRIGWSRSRRTYSLERFDHPLLKLHLPQEALEALALIRSTFCGLPSAEQVETLVSTIEARLPECARRMLDRKPLPAYALAPADEWQRHASSLEVVERAVRDHQRLEFEYRSPKRSKAEGPKRHVVEPYNLEYREGHLYFEGYNVETGRVYLYRVDRIVLGSARELPHVFMPRERLHKPVTIRYRLAPEIARYGASRRFLHHQEEKQEDGSVIVTGEAYSLFEAFTTLLKYGSGCRVLEPPELVEMVRQEARKMVQVYERAAS